MREGIFGPPGVIEFGLDEETQRRVVDAMLGLVALSRRLPPPRSSLGRLGLLPSYEEKYGFVIEPDRNPGDWLLSTTRDVAGREVAVFFGGREEGEYRARKGSWITNIRNAQDRSINRGTGPQDKFARTRAIDLLEETRVAILG